MSARLALIAATVVTATALSCGTAAARPHKPAPNTGKPGSPCKSSAFKGPDAGPAADVDTTSLGKAAPAAYEIGAATNAADRLGPPRRVMMFVHGGAWFTVGRKAMRTEREVATKWRAAGWQTVSISYRACRRSLGDVIRFYDLIRARVGPAVPICLRGQSAGGHLALMVAAKRPDVACVISLASPTDLRVVKAQGRIEAASGSGPPGLRQGGARVTRLAAAAFGKRRLRARSPVTYASQIAARLLLATAVNDVVVPQGQATALAQAVTSLRPGAYVDQVRLEVGSTEFVHGSASTAATHDFDERSATLVSPFGQAPLDAGPPIKAHPVNPLSNLLNGIFGLFGRRN